MAEQAFDTEVATSHPIEHQQGDASETLSQVSRREGLEAAFFRAFEPKRQDVLVIAIVPAFNEDRFIGSVVLKSRLYADRVIVVDDGSTEHTAVVARDAGASVIAHPANRGKASALKTGFSRACELGADIVVTLDGDGQHDPAQIPALIHPILHDQADMVIGSRFRDVKSQIPAWRQASQHTLTLRKILLPEPDSIVQGVDANERNWRLCGRLLTFIAQPLLLSSESKMVTPPDSLCLSCARA